MDECPHCNAHDCQCLLVEELDRMRRERDDAINAKKVIIDERIDELEDEVEALKFKVYEARKRNAPLFDEVRDLRSAFDDIIVWAARYAHGRATYAPSTVRHAVEARKRFDPEWKATGRVGLEPLDRDHPLSLPSDDLTDLFPPEDS